MTLRLGDQREALEVLLCRGDDFIDTIRLESDAGVPVDWPTGTTATLHLTSEDDEWTWTALVDGPHLRWDIDSTTVDTIADRTRARLTLDYDDGRGPFVWAKGSVVWV